MSKKNFLYVVVIVSILLVSLTGCQSSQATSDVKRVVYLINGALGDNAFYDSGQAGMDKIAEQYGVETAPSKRISMPGNTNLR
jgi:basic membrane protein A